jgi:hypothetical protein
MRIRIASNNFTAVLPQHFYDHGYWFILVRVQRKLHGVSGFFIWQGKKVTEKLHLYIHKNTKSVIDKNNICIFHLCNVFINLSNRIKLLTYYNGNNNEIYYLLMWNKLAHNFGF